MQWDFSFQLVSQTHEKGDFIVETEACLGPPKVITPAHCARNAQNPGLTPPSGEAHKEKGTRNTA